jgi:hypothetical protein
MIRRLGRIFLFVCSMAFLVASMLAAFTLAPINLKAQGNNYNGDYVRNATTGQNEGCVDLNQLPYNCYWGP